MDRDLLKTCLFFWIFLAAKSFTRSQTSSFLTTLLHKDTRIKWLMFPVPWCEFFFFFFLSSEKDHSPIALMTGNVRSSLSGISTFGKMCCRLFSLIYCKSSGVDVISLPQIKSLNLTICSAKSISRSDVYLALRGDALFFSSGILNIRKVLQEAKGAVEAIHQTTLVKKFCRLCFLQKYAFGCFWSFGATSVNLLETNP